MNDQTFDDALWSFRRALPGRARIYVAGCSGEPLALAKFLDRNPEWAEGVTFLGIWIPGVNAVDWSSYHESARSESIFLSPATSEAFGREHFAFRPLRYTQSVQWLANTPLDGGVVMTSSCSVHGDFALGVSADFSTEIISRNVPLLALANQAMPRPLHGPLVQKERFSAIAECDHPLVQVEPSHLPPAFEAIGGHVASLIDDGAMLQFGLGNVQQAVIESLHSHRGLNIHSGMVSTPLVDLMEAGSVADRQGAITTGVAIGTETLYQQVATDPRVIFKPVRETHAARTLAALPRFTAINSCLSVDLFGQANAEFVDQSQVSGTGGLVDFLRGADESEGGRGILALTSTARRGRISRIVPRLDPNAVSVARQDVDTVITEHGIAELRHTTIEERARRLIAIADPAFQETLAEQWSVMRASMA